MHNKIILSATCAAALSFATGALADMPVFSAQCPTGITISANPAGNVQVNGTPASVVMFNQHYYEAKAGGITFPISTAEDGSDLHVRFEPPGSAGGFCTILSEGSASAPSDTTAGAGGPDHFAVSVNGRLNVRASPSASATLVGKLPSGTVVEKLGCQEIEGRTWCHIADGDASGWAAADFLTEASGPVRSAQVTPVVANGSASHTIERVQFPRGQTGTEFSDSLEAGGSRRYVLGARNGQSLYFRLAASGPGMTYVVYNPDGSVMQDEVGAGREFRNGLWQSGDHTIEVYNTSNEAQSYNVIFGIN
ncbi:MULTISPECIES: SH3 domain-containing protein [unclassified Roseitalea]|uniref:SH3 domain-containing protein n=1 Tax=unclassified Roseitalea TaxID=2639107 RepID=UPI00273F8E3F|nr:MULTISPECIES: SH3 domain-containing protein [unclassified Roseitalea]